jgi:hydrogenase expression/formation protein HypC
VRGVLRDVSLFMLEEGSVAVGDSVLVHVGYAIQVISDDEARATWQVFDEVLSTEPER